VLKKVVVYHTKKHEKCEKKNLVMFEIIIIFKNKTFSTTKGVHVRQLIALDFE